MQGDPANDLHVHKDHDGTVRTVHVAQVNTQQDGMSVIPSLATGFEFCVDSHYP
jgi:hypothetical protein